MNRLNIYVELIDFNEVFHIAFIKFLRNQLIEYRSQLYQFHLWNASVQSTAALPDISVIGTRDSDSDRDVFKALCKCNTGKVATFGSRKKFLSLSNLDVYSWREQLLLMVNTNGNETHGFHYPSARFDFRETMPAPQSLLGPATP